MKKYFTVGSRVQHNSTVVCTFTSPEGNSYRMFTSVEAALDTPAEISTNPDAQSHREWAPLSSLTERTLNSSWVEVTEEQLRACLVPREHPSNVWTWPPGFNTNYTGPVYWRNAASGRWPATPEDPRPVPKTNHRIGVPKNKLP